MILSKTEEQFLIPLYFKQQIKSRKGFHYHVTFYPRRIHISIIMLISFIPNFHVSFTIKNFYDKKQRN